MDQLLEAFAVLFVTIGPLDNAALFAGMTAGTDRKYKFRMATKSCLISALLLLFFMLFGDDLLRYLDIQLSSLKIGGGLLLLLFAIRLVMNNGNDEDSSGASQSGASETDASSNPPDISVFPLATQMIAGPSAIVAGVLVISQVQGDVVMQGAMIGVMLIIILGTWIAFMMASVMSRYISSQALDVMARVLAVILVALAVEFIITGIGDTTTFNRLIDAIQA